jgi:5-methylcytosine-specific restriction endonuclease McrA
MAQVLLLNASYEPLAVLNHRRAICLLLSGKVESNSTDAIPIRGPSQVFYTPTVIRLRRYVHVPRRNIHWSRKGVLERDCYRCAYCGRNMRDQHRRRGVKRTKPTVDHILPVSRGGKNTWTNTVCACPDCNQRKADRMPHEAGMPLLWEPKAPRTNYWVASGDIPRTWKVYFER